jgi:hypothetical protein
VLWGCCAYLTLQPRTGEVFVAARRLGISLPKMKIVPFAQNMKTRLSSPLCSASVDSTRGAETGNPEFRAEVRDRRGELVATAFMRECPDYLRTDHNYRAIAATVAYKSSLSPSEQERDIDEVVATLIERGYWTKHNLVAAYNALNAEGYLDVPAGSTRNLSSGERLRVTRMAQNGHVDAALGEYLRCA